MNILAETNDWFAVEKPAMVSAEALLAELRRFRRGEKFSPIYLVDKEILGILLCAKTIEARNILKNAYGSDAFTLRFLAWGWSQKQLETSWECDLSIAWDDKKERSYPSKTAGKKSCTHFSVVQNFSPYVQLECDTHYLRTQQIQTHAHYSGVDIIGDELWTTDPHFIYLDQLKSVFKKQTHAPIIPGLNLIQTELIFPYQGSEQKLCLTLPSSWPTLLKLLERYHQERKVSSA